MFNIMSHLYDYWIGEPDPDKWPEYLQDDPVRGHGRYSFREGLILGLLLYAECMAGELRWS